MPSVAINNVLPVEVIAHILRMATTAPTCYALTKTYVPFQNVPGENVLPESRAALSKLEAASWITKLSIVRVCKAWKSLALEYLYEEVYMGEHAKTLSEALEKSETMFPREGVGRRVRCIVLSAWRPEIKPIPLPEVLRWCPNTEILVKSDDDTTPTPNPDVDLSSIKRFDWRFTRFQLFAERGLHWQNTHQGLDFFRDAMMRSDNVHYLAVGIRYPMSRLSDNPRPHIATHSLTTLRVHHIGPVIRAEIEGWDCPNLTHIITDSSLMWETYSPIFGPRIEVVELIKDESLHSIFALGVVEKCPNLLELNYHVEYGQFPSKPIHQDTLRCIRLYAGRNYMIDLADTWELLKAQFTLFAGPSFPSLRRLVLYGDWDDVLRDSQFVPLKDGVLARGCAVETNSMDVGYVFAAKLRYFYL
ncbi:hypothetical protein BDZ94DRAFT_598101 [Collybia nuda]|uniref:Uncharacterized protein n=1 Tax=Collybia nuda TaxID=64659 RepID=A0A9P5Y8J2_9AGAR|nr:hypothetical protein BDZ94DRAFT_598101 [Collybia nuda]